MSFPEEKLQSLKSSEVPALLPFTPADGATFSTTAIIPLRRSSMQQDVTAVVVSPRDWSQRKRWLVTFAVAWFCFIVALGSAMPTADLAEQRRYFDCSEEVINLSISLFVLGFGLGPMVFAPLSEVFGRRLIYLVSTGFYFAFTLPSALARNVETMLIARALAGIASSAPMTLVGGTLSDIWSDQDRGIPMAIFSATVFSGPCLGPLIAGWLYVGTENWRWTYWLLCIFTGISFGIAWMVPETLWTVVHGHSIPKQTQERSDTDSYQPGYKVAPDLGPILKTALIRPFEMMCTEPLLIAMSIYLCFIYMLLYLLFFAFPIAFVEVRGFSVGMVGTTFLSIIIGVAIAGGLLWYQEVLYAREMAKRARPEARLFPMMLGCILQPLSLFIFAFTGGEAGIHWIWPCISGVIFGVALLLIYAGANSYIVDSYPKYAGSAMAAKTLLRSVAGATVPLWVNQMFHGVGFRWAGLTLALVAVLLVPIPFVFYVRGHVIRARSKMASSLA